MSRIRRTPNIVTSRDGSMKLAPFFTDAFVFSNHFVCRFVVEGLEFCCTEQFYMYFKAQMFGDEESASAIIRSTNPKEIKRMGAQIRLFDTEKWRQVSILVMTVANWMKYQQNAELRIQLLNTAGSLLVEAAPNDNYWGIGNNIANAQDVQKWNGKNVMGRILTKIRDNFLKMSSTQPPLSFNISNVVEFPPLVAIRADVHFDQGNSALASQKEADQPQMEIAEEGDPTLGLEIVKESQVESKNASASEKLGEEIGKNASATHGKESDKFENEGFGEESEKVEGKLAEEFGKVGISEKAELIVEYLVCQVEEKSATAGRLKTLANKSWPHFLSISNNLVNGRALQLGDTVGVKKFEWRNEYKNLAKNESERSNWKKLWYVQKINSQAIVSELNHVNYAQWTEHPGIVLRVREMSSGRKLCAIIISSGLQMSTRCYRRQLTNLDLESLQEGQLVKVWTAGLPQQSLVDSAYILPPQSEFKFGTESQLEEGKGVLACIGEHAPWPYQQQSQNVFYPLHPEMSEAEIELAEKIMSAAIACSFEEEEKKIIECRFEGSAQSEDRNFWLKFAEIDIVRVKKLKEVWEDEAIVVLRTAMNTPAFSSGYVKSSDVESIRAFGKPIFNFWVVVKVANIQERKRRDVHEELQRAEEGGHFVAHPIIPKGLKDRKTCFSSNLPSKLCKLDTNQGKLMRALMGRAEDEIVVVSDEGESSKNALARKMAHPLIQQLNSRQQKTARLLLDDAAGKLVYQQAPPGVGKTHVAATVVGTLLAMKKNVKVAVVTAANLPLAKLAKELEGVLGGDAMEQSGSIALFSGYAKEKYKEMIEELRRHILVSKLKSEEILKKLGSQGGIREAKKYCQDFENRPRLTKERQMASLVAEVSDLRVVFATASMAEEMYSSALDNSTILIFDEATQGSWVELVHLVSRLPSLEKIFITGDKYQLGVHLQKLPSLLQKGFGLESMVEQLVVSPMVVHTRLETCYRMHPLLVDAVSYAAYEQNDERLEAGRTAEERSLLTASQFPLPIQSCPMTLLNIVGTCRQDNLSHSLTNDQQTASAVQLVSALKSNVPQASVVVICLYLFQRDCIHREIEELGLNALVVSVDGFQAQESDIIVLVTTRSSSREGNLGESSEFLVDSRRATVAISRARHGLFVIGDLLTLEKGEVWRRFINRASETTQAVGNEYFQVLKSGEYHRDRFGQLMDSNWRLVGDMTNGRRTERAENNNRPSRNETWRRDEGSWRKRRADDGPSMSRDESWRPNMHGKVFVRGGGRAGSSGGCYTCGEQGHMARECWNNRSGRGGGNSRR